MGTGTGQKSYVRLTVQTVNSRRVVWAVELRRPAGSKYLRYQVVDRHGDESGELILADERDIVSRKTAEFDLKYGTLKVT